MRKLFLSVCIVAIGCVFSNCGKLSKAIDQISEITETKEVNYRMFENEEELKAMYDDIVTKLGEQATVVDEIRIYISRPSHEGSIKRQGKPDELNITIHTQDPSNPKRIRETRYWSNSGGWQPSEQREIQVMGSNAEKYKLEDDLFNFSEKVTFDIFKKVVQDAYEKHKDTEKYEMQYIKSIDIDKKGYDVTIYGKLASNEQEKKNYYKADFTGKSKR